MSTKNLSRTLIEGGHHRYNSRSFPRVQLEPAPAGRLGIIPGSMGTKTYVVRGLGNPLAFESASHGAGSRRNPARATDHFVREGVR